MTQPLKDRISKVFALDAERTPGEWNCGEHDEPANNGDDSEYNYSYWISSPAGCGDVLGTVQDYQIKESDVHFIAASTDMPSIIRELLAVIEKQREALGYYADCNFYKMSDFDEVLLNDWGEVATKALADQIVKP